MDTIEQAGSSCRAPGVDVTTAAGAAALGAAPAAADGSLLHATTTLAKHKVESAKTTLRCDMQASYSGPPRKRDASRPAAPSTYGPRDSATKDSRRPELLLDAASSFREKDYFGQCMLQPPWPLQS